MVACGVGRLLLEGRESQIEGALAPLSRWTSAVTAWLLAVSGTNFAREAATFSHSEGFSYRVTYLCTGLVLIVFFLAGLAAFPAGARSKGRAAILGTLAILALNQLRLVTLFWIGAGNPGAFDFVHGVVWEAVMLLSVLGLWLCFGRAAARSPGVAGS